MNNLRRPLCGDNHGIFDTECDGMGANTRNPGINDYGLRFGYAF
jgi:hypothetical protein